MPEPLGFAEAADDNSDPANALERIEIPADT
jgi:hypothetical protein